MFVNKLNVIDYSPSGRGVLPTEEKKIELGLDWRLWIVKQSKHKKYWSPLGYEKKRSDLGSNNLRNEKAWRYRPVLELESLHLRDVANETKQEHGHCFFVCIAMIELYSQATTTTSSKPVEIPMEMETKKVLRTRSSRTKADNVHPGEETKKMIIALRFKCAQLVSEKNYKEWWREEEKAEKMHVRDGLQYPLLFTSSKEFSDSVKSLKSLKPSTKLDLQKLIQTPEYQGNTRLLKKIVESSWWQKSNVGFLILTHQGRLYQYVFANKSMRTWLNRTLHKNISEFDKLEKEEEKPKIKKIHEKDDEKESKFYFALLYHSAVKLPSNMVEYHWKLLYRQDARTDKEEFLIPADNKLLMQLIYEDIILYKEKRK
jgi:hypothetical protein